MGTCRQGIPRHHMFPPEISPSVGFRPACSVVVEATPLIQMPGTKSGAMMILTPSMCQPLLVLTCLTIQNGPWCWNHRFWWPPSSVGFHRFPRQTAGLSDFNSCSGLEDVQQVNDVAFPQRPDARTFSHDFFKSNTPVQGSTTRMKMIEWIGMAGPQRACISEINQGLYLDQVKAPSSCGHPKLRICHCFWPRH